MTRAMRLTFRLLKTAAFLFLGYTASVIGGPATTAGCAINLALYAALTLRIAFRWLNRPLVDGR